MNFPAATSVPSSFQPREAIFPGDDDLDEFLSVNAPDHLTVPPGLRIARLLLVIVLVHAQLGLAAEPAATGGREDLTWTDPNQAAADDPDFLVQGDYGDDRPSAAWGLQVVALGGGQFDAYLLEGGLPGAGWTRQKKRIKLSGTLQNGIVKLDSPDAAYAATIQDHAAKVFEKGRLLVDLPKIERKSPTLGTAPPEGAVVLFDGTSADAWINGRMANGLLVNDDITSKQTFGDFSLHLEFRTPFKPYARGQRRGNSGVYLQGRYEAQVLDSFGLDGRKNECGGIYSIAAPEVNACFPPLSWQTYDIDFTAARFGGGGKLLHPAQMTVRLNGVLVQNEQPLPHTTTAAPVKTITPDPGPIFIQHHRNIVYYRNIWVVPK